MSGGAKRPGDVQPTQAGHAELRRVAQARRVLRCYEEVEGRPAPDVATVWEWMECNEGRVPLDARGKIVPL